MTETNKDALLSQWKSAAAQAADWKREEAELRKQVVAAFSADAKPGHSGTETIDLGWGYKLKIEHGLNYKLDTANDCEKTDKALDLIEHMQEGGNIIAQRLVKWKPELSVSEYKKLDPAQKAIIDQVITVTDATPSVKLVPPTGAA